MARTLGEYVADARTRLLALFDEHLALVQPEALARLGESWHYRSEYVPTKSGNLDEHVVRMALGLLSSAGTIRSEKTSSRGGHSVSVYVPTDTHLRSTRIAAAAARKRSLYARYESWAQGTKRYPQGLIGPAGEDAVQRAITASTSLQTFRPGGGSFTEVDGFKLLSQVDNGGYLVVPQPHGPPSVAAVLIEVKNVRQWIYPNSGELYQLLHKSAMLKAARPDLPVVPVLVCRRAHPWTLWMAEQLGFFVIPMDRQFLSHHVDGAEMNEVRVELSFQDLAIVDSSGSLRVRDRLTTTLPKVALRTAGKWSETVAQPEVPTLLRDMFRASSARHMSPHLTRLKKINQDLGRVGGWR